MPAWLAIFTFALQLLCGSGNGQFTARRLLCRSVEASTKEPTIKSPLWLLPVRARNYVKVYGPPNQLSLRIGVNGVADKYRGSNLSSGSQETPDDHPGWLKWTSRGSYLEADEKSKGNCNGNSACFLETGSNKSVFPNGTFAEFAPSSRSLRAEPELQRLSSLCRSLAIASPSCSLYGGLRGVVDYGVAGYALLENLRAALRYHFTSSPLPGSYWTHQSDHQDEHRWDQGALEGDERDLGGGRNVSTLRDNVFLVETATIGPVAMWRHSGHLELFHDEAVQCTDTGSLIRIDSLVFRRPHATAGVRDFQVAFVGDINDLRSDGNKNGKSKDASVPGADPTTSVSAAVQQTTGGEVERGNGWIPLTEAPLSLYPHLPSPFTGRRGALRPPRAFSPMMHIDLKGRPSSGSNQMRIGGNNSSKEQAKHANELQEDSQSDSVAILRPETAQNIFVAYKALMPLALRPRLPLGLAQEGRAYRNESQGARSSFLLRLREFRQFEIEYFTAPEDDKDVLLAQWTEHIKSFFLSVGIPADALQTKETPKEDLPHYASRCIDFSYLMRCRNGDGSSTESPKEICGLALRGDYDLYRHQRASGISLGFHQWLQSQGGSAGAAVLPHVIETSIGVDRLLLAMLHSALTEDEVLGRRRVFLNLHPALAPYKVAVLPIVVTNRYIEALARKIYNNLRKQFFVIWDSTGSLGRRYRKADELGVPFCISVDDESARSQRAKIRWRNTGAQIVLPLSKIAGFLQQRCTFSPR